MENETKVSLKTAGGERPKVEIDGELYEMRSPGELTQELAESIFGALTKAEEMSGDAMQAFDNIVKASREVLIGVPDEIHARMPLEEHGKALATYAVMVAEAIDVGFGGELKAAVERIAALKE